MNLEIKEWLRGSLFSVQVTFFQICKCLNKLISICVEELQYLYSSPSTYPVGCMELVDAPHPVGDRGLAEDYEQVKQDDVDHVFFSEAASGEGEADADGPGDAQHCYLGISNSSNLNI